MYIEDSLFSKVIEYSPLVSIDLIIRNKNDQVLLGKRINKPAQGNWFVPGGRIFKNESISNAFKRLTLEEIGHDFSIDEASLLGHYEHFYNDNVFGDDFSTHYVVLAYVLKIETFTLNLPVGQQHLGYKWFDVINLLDHDLVNQYTKDYFN